MTDTIITSQTRSGTAYAVMPLQADGPAPTLLLLVIAGVDTLTTDPYCRVGWLLHAQGWNVASLNLPCHGDDRRPGEKGTPTELADWAGRLAAGEDIVAAFQAQVNDLIEYLIATGAADPSHIIAAGSSRGAFMAFHAAVANPRIRAIAAFGPVTDLLALSEFSGLEKNLLVQRLALHQTVDTLADRDIWITIGNADTRVGTDKAVAYTEALMNATATRKLSPRLTLHVMPVLGHTTAPGMYEEAARWMATVCGESQNKPGVALRTPSPDHNHTKGPR